MLASGHCFCWHEVHKQAAWAASQLVLASTQLSTSCVAGEVICLRRALRKQSHPRACAGWLSRWPMGRYDQRRAATSRPGGGSLLARKLCCCWHEAHKQAAWAVRQLVLASTYKLVGLQLMQPHRFTQPKQNGWSLHGRDAAAVQLMGRLLQCIQCGSSHQADAGHGGNLLARNGAFAGTMRTSKRRRPRRVGSLPGNAVGVREPIARICVILRRQGELYML